MTELLLAINKYFISNLNINIIGYVELDTFGGNRIKFCLWFE